MNRNKKIKNVILKINENLSILDIIVSLIFGIAFAVLPSYYNKGHSEFNSKILLCALGLAILFVFLTVLFRVIIIFVDNRNKNMKKLEMIVFNKNKYRLLIFALIILLCWTPILISLFPGTFSNDTFGQISQLYYLRLGGGLQDNHPVLTTLLIGNMILPLSLVTGNWHLFMFIYVIIQAIATSLVFAYTLIYAKEKLKLNNKFIIFFLAIYCLLPIFPGAVQAINKDALFSWIYVLFAINYIEIVRTNGENLKNNKSLILMIILSILCSLTKKVGMYVILLSFIPMFFTKILNKRRIMVPFICTIIFMMIIMPILFEMFGIGKGGQQEKYSLLFQQTARYLKYHMNDTTEEEIQIIEEVIGKDVNKIVEVYDPILADPVKGFVQMTEDENYIKYLKVWAKQGLRHPKTYLDAANAMLSGWISFREYKPLMNMNWHSQLNTFITPKWVAERDVTKESAEFIQNAYDKIYEIPIFGIVLSKGLYTVLIPGFAFCSVIKYKSKRNWLVIVPMILSLILGCFLAPASNNWEGQRYLYPVIYTSVLTLMWVIYCIKNRESEITN